MFANCFSLSLARSKCPINVSDGDAVGDGSSEVTPDLNKTELGQRKVTPLCQAYSSGTQEKGDMVWRQETSSSTYLVWGPWKHGGSVYKDLIKVETPGMGENANESSENFFP